jgi:UDP-N-acetylglucosamine--N-acetylmuramyl-(pentapeptide) pyrophosphoryl-undecaprenol N-acetylglucosamine transferase
LVTGGSLGAKNINEAIAASIQDFSSNDLQLIWQTGKTFAPLAMEVSKGRKNVWTGDFITNMEFAFAAADIVVSRSGAMAVSELSAAKKPVIFVPFPFAAEDHQTVNAKKLTEKNAAILITDQQVSDQLLPAIINLAADTVKQNELKENIGRLAILNADDIIAKEILRNIND